MNKLALFLPILGLGFLIACQETPSPSTAPLIESLSANPSSLPLGGGSTELTWQVKNASLLSLDQGIGIVSGTTKTVTMTTTTTYTLTAANAAGATTSKQITVNVAAPANVPMYALTETNQILSLNSSNPSQALSTVSIVGLAAGEEPVAMDVRPQNGLLYGLVRDGSGNVKLNLINPNNGVTQAVSGIVGNFVDALGNVMPVTGNEFDLEFNPVVDRARVVTSTGLNFRINPNTGALIDGDFGGAAGSVAGINPDGPINGGITGLQAAAYTNNAPNSSVTTLYTMNVAASRLYLQNPPNAGTQTKSLPITLNGAAVNLSGNASLDIAAGVNTTASNAPVTGGLAYGHLTIAGTTGLYAINLASGAATLTGTFGTLPSIRDMAISNLTANAMALSLDGTQLLRFAVNTPGTTSSVNLTGVTVGETLVALSQRPATGQIYGFGLNDTANTGSLYLVDPQSGTCTVVGVGGQIAFVDAASSPVDLPVASVGYGLDFNPIVDRLRVVVGTGLNFRINPNTGGPIDGDLGGAAGSVTGINTDGAINSLPVGSTGVTGAAYTNSFAQPLGAGVTTLYTLDPSSNRLHIQNPANAGTQTNSQPITLAGNALDFDTMLGFDIPSSVTVSTLSSVATGEGFAALTVAGSAGLYRINLSSGAATLVGNLSVPVRSLLVTP